MSVRDYRDLRVWQRAVDLASACYEVAARLPASERFGLAGQLRRASVSVAANIAEGNGRLHRRAYLAHLSIARGSLKELETHLVLAQRLGLVDAAACDRARRLADEVSRLMTGLMRALSPK